MDFSGNYMFLGVVIGGRSVLERFYTHLSGKYGVIHARRLGKLRFSVLKDILSKNLMFYCLYVDMNYVLGKLGEIFPRTSKSVFLLAFSHALWEIIENEILSPHNIKEIYICKDVERVIASKNIAVVCDKYCLKDLADPVAWINLKKSRGMSRLNSEKQKVFELARKKVKDIDVRKRVFTTARTYLRRRPALL